MSATNIDLFRAIGGIDLQNEALTSHVNILQGTGLPGGDTSVQDAAPIGSVFLRTDANSNTLQVYSKFTNTNNTSADWVALADQTYVDNAIDGLSWKNPAVALNTTATTLPAGTPASPIIIDGVSVTNGQRVLFAGLTSNPDVYDYVESTGTWVLDPTSPAPAHAGDALFVTGGTVGAGQRWVFNGTQWVLFGTQTDVSEINYIDTFIGKGSLGSVTPTYTGLNIVTSGQALNVAISNLDIALGTGNITTGNILTSNLAFDGPAPGGAGSLTVTAALDELNKALGSFVITNTGGSYPLSSPVTSVTAALNTLNNAVENNTVIITTINGEITTIDGEITTINGTLTTIEGEITTIQGDITTIDGEITALQDAAKTTTTAIPAATQTAVDSLAAPSAVTEIKWLLQVKDTTTSGVRASEIHAITDGTSVDFTRYGELTLNGSVAGFAVAVAIVSGNLVLQVTTTNASEAVVKRVAFSAF